MRLRFWLASLLRMSDNLAANAVAAYDRLFQLRTSQQAEIYFQMGLESARASHIEEAQEMFRKAANVNPQDEKPWIELGVLHVRKQAPQAALFAFGKALELNKPSGRLHRHQAEAYILLGRLDDALKSLEQAASLEPQDAEIACRIGFVLDRLGKFDAAVAALTKAVELCPEELRYHQSLGFALEGAGRRKEAIRCFKRALELEHVAVGSE